MNVPPLLEVIALEGELDLAQRDHLARILRAEGAGPAILVDLVRVRYADSTAIAALMRVRAEAQRHGRRIALLIGDPHLARVLHYAGLREAFAIFDDRGAALSYLAGTA